jgi:DNA invertase Pin-like site-specific DNA recombinase
MAVIYARVSEDDRRERRSVGEQEEECRNEATEEGWTVAEAFVDNDRSASRHARKARESYARLLSYLETEQVDILVLWESSRGGRELEAWASLLNLCRRRGISIHVVSHHRTYDMNVSRDWLTLAEDGVDSAYESEKTRDRILRSVRAKAKTGQPHGKLLYGYRRTYDDRGNFVAQVINEETAAIVREAAHRVSEGESTRSIAVDFNKRGIPSAREGEHGWSLSQIKRMVINPGYIGQRVHRGQIVGPAQWPAILDEKIYTVCVARLTDEKRKTMRDTSLKYLLSGIAHCGVCGSRMRVQKNRTHMAYICYGNFCASIRYEKLDDFITAMLFERLRRPDALALLAPPQTDNEREMAEQEVKELKARLATFYAQAAKGKLTAVGLATIEGELLPQIEKAEWRSRAVDVPPLLRKLVGPDVEQRWERLTIAQQREAVSLVMEIRLAKTYKGARTFDPNRLAGSRWRGDSKTWGEHWADAGLTWAAPRQRKRSPAPVAP